MQYILSQDEYENYLEYKKIVEEKIKIIGVNERTYLSGGYHTYRNKIYVDLDEATKVLADQIDILKSQLANVQQALNEERAKPKSWF